jgi:hypothetical protein
MMELAAAQVVVENGTLPVDDVFTGLAPPAANRGITDIDRLLERAGSCSNGREWLRAAPDRRCRHRPGVQRHLRRCAWRGAM